jgi:hypothetical protein
VPASSRWSPITTRVTPSPASQSPSPSSAAVIVETVRTSCIRRLPGPGTRAQHTTSALLTSSAATRSMTSGSSVSTCIAIASACLSTDTGADTRGSCRERRI